MRSLDSNTPPAPTFATIARCARPVEEYLRQSGEPARGTTGTGAVSTLRPVDAFLLHQLAAMLSSPHVVDLAADATGGATAALWSSHESLRSARAPRRGGDGTWRERFAERLGPGRGDGTAVLLDGPPLTGPEGWAAVADAVSLSGPVLILVHGGEPELAGLLVRALAAMPRACAAVLGLGRTGANGALAELVNFHRLHPGYRLCAARELSPFLAESDLALIYPAADADVPAALERIALSFDGNFQFINLLQAAAEAAVAESPAAGAAPRGASSGAARPAEQDYPRLVERVRETVRDAVPAGASLLVVSKGDDELLRIEGRRAAHFPQAKGGTYAGHHPADNDAAVVHLEALRAAGARYLVVPATSVWWLEHYEGFRRYLEATAAVVVCRPETCLVFDLAGRSATATGSAPRRTATPGPGPGRGRPNWLSRLVRVLEEWRRRLGGRRTRDRHGKHTGNSATSDPDSSPAGPREGGDAP
jgi:hypothetical protein